MDNLRTHKLEGVAEALKAVGVKVRYLPAYSPDLNPIEMAFAKLKAALRKGGAHMFKALWKLISKLVKEFAPEECANYFQLPATGDDPRHVGNAVAKVFENCYS
jgi:transposase